jgi:hypothetical protein
MNAEDLAAAQLGGSRVLATASNYDTALKPLRSVSDLMADSARPIIAPHGDRPPCAERPVLARASQTPCLIAACALELSPELADER